MTDNGLRAQTLLSWPSEVRLLRWLGLGGARRVLDIGCGAGYVAAQLLQDFDGLRVLGLDTDRELLHFAAHETADWPGRATFVESRAEACPVANESVDFVLARYVFQHLEDPVSTAREALRVLEPRGRIAVVDVDAALWGLTEPAIDSNAGAGPPGKRVGRRLWRILQSAGFEDVHVDAFLYHSDAMGLEPFAQQLDARFTQAPDAFVMLVGLIGSGVRRD